MNEMKIVKNQLKLSQYLLNKRYQEVKLLQEKLEQLVEQNEEKKATIKQLQSMVIKYMIKEQDKPIPVREPQAFYDYDCDDCDSSKWEETDDNDYDDFGESDDDQIEDLDEQLEKREARQELQNSEMYYMIKEIYELFFNDEDGNDLENLSIEELYSENLFNYIVDYFNPQGSCNEADVILDYDSEQVLSVIVHFEHIDSGQLKQAVKTWLCNTIQKYNDNPFLISQVDILVNPDRSANDYLDDDEYAINYVIDKQSDR